MRTRREPMVGRQRHHEGAGGKSFHLEIFVPYSRAHESDIHGPGLDSSSLSDRIQTLDVDLDLTMHAGEAMQDTGNGHELGPRGTRNREVITPVSHRPPGREHRTVRLCEDLPRRLEKQSTSVRQPYPPFGAIEQPDLRSEEHTSELQSLRHLVCRLLL